MPLLVLYGSNLGTAEHLARNIANDGSNQGFDVTVATLDEYVNKLPKEGGVVIVTASYNGMPPDNAAKFCGWLQDAALPVNAFDGVEYTVFGCGNRDWGTTYQAVPTLVDKRARSARRQANLPAGAGDAWATLTAITRAGIPLSGSRSLKSSNLLLPQVKRKTPRRAFPSF